MKLNRIIYMGAMAMALASCSEYLNEAPAELLSADKFYQTQSQATQGIIGVYSDLRFVSDYEYGLMAEVRSDNTWAEPICDAQRDWNDIGVWKADASVGTFESCWNTWYKVIYDANVAISKIEGTTYNSQAIHDQLLNEAYFLRGYAHFELVRLFGNVPMITKPLTPSEANNVKQSDGKTVIEQLVIPDLEKACNLPDRGNILDALGKKTDAGVRADKQAAQAMLARVYMTLAGFPYNDTSASAKAETYINLFYDDNAGGVWNTYWAPDIKAWRTMFTPDGFNTYSIFAIQYRAGGTGNPMQFNQVKNLPPSYVDNVTIRSGGNFFGNSLYLEVSLRHEFDKTYGADGHKDYRGVGWSCLDGYDAEGTTKAYDTTVRSYTLEDGTFDVNYNSMFYKNLPSKPKMTELGLSMDYKSITTYQDWPVNLAIIRVEDIMLYKAELLIAKGNIDKAMKIVNLIRKRAGCDDVTASDAATALKLVKRERRLEFVGEGVRWFDEVRYGEWKTDAIAKFNRYGNPSGTDPSNIKDGRYLFPIPSNQLSIQPGTYNQNPGY